MRCSTVGDADADAEAADAEAADAEAADAEAADAEARSVAVCAFPPQPA